MAIEIVAEKNTVLGTIKPVAMKYGIPVTAGRGFCSLPPRHDMHQRYKKSGKNQLVLLVLSDFDPEGEVIPEAFAKSMRDDFSVAKIFPVKVALTAKQSQQHGLPASLEAKKTSTNYKRFVKKYGSADVWELEALEPQQLQTILRMAIDSVIDVKAFNAEIAAEKADAAALSAIRKSAKEQLMAIADLNLDG